MFSQFPPKTTDVSESSGEIPLQSLNEKVPEDFAQLKETLLRHLRLFLARDKSWLKAEKPAALALQEALENLETKTEARLICLIRQIYDNPISPYDPRSTLLTYIYSGLYEYFKIPEKKICKAIMDKYREYGLGPNDDVFSSALKWEPTYNSIVRPMILPYLRSNPADRPQEEQKNEMEWRITSPLNQLLDVKISAYIQCATTDTGYHRAQTLRDRVKSKGNDDSSLFADILNIYNGCGKDSLLGSSTYLRSSVGKALAEFLNITEDDICVQEFHDCEKDLRKGDKDLAYRDIRNEAIRKLINSRVENLRKAASTKVTTTQHEATEETKKETTSDECILTNKLSDAITKHVETLKQQPAGEKQEMAVERAMTLLGTVKKNAEKDESVQLKWSINTFLNWTMDSPLGKDFELRFVMGKVLCEEFGITIESNFLQSPYPPAQNQLHRITPLIQRAWNARIVTGEHSMKFTR